MKVKHHLNKLKSSCIRHPENSYFIRRYDWQIKALQTNKPARNKDTFAEGAAEIMSLMEYHYNNRLANRMLREVIEQAMVKSGPKRNSLVEIGDWMPYSVAYLKECLFNGRATGVIIASLQLLVDRGFVSIDVPDDIVKTYFTNANWYKLEVNTINAWIDANITKSWLDEWKKPRKGSYKLSSQAETPKDVPETINFSKSLEWRHVFERFKGALARSGESFEGKLLEMMREHVESSDEKNWILGSDLLAAMKERVGKEADRFWLDYMRRTGRWVEGEHYIRPSAKKIYYDIDVVWADCVGYEKGRKALKGKRTGEG